MYSPNKLNEFMHTPWYANVLANRRLGVGTDQDEVREELLSNQQQ